MRKKTKTKHDFLSSLRPPSWIYIIMHLYRKQEELKKKKKSRPQQGPQKKFIDKLDAIRHETLGTSPEGTVHNLENKI